MTGKAGDVLIHVAELSEDLKAVLESLPPQRLTEAQTALEAVSDEILLDVAQLRSPDAPKTVHISCIYPKNNQVEPFNTHHLRLERALSRNLTPRLIAFHQRKEMQDLGYRPVVRNDTWKMELQNKTVTCQAAGPTRVIPRKAADYSIVGEVAVIRTPANINQVALAIEFVRNLPPPPCKGPIPIAPKEFHSDMLYRQDQFSSSFSQEIWPAYERAWMESAACQ